eukprot:2515698-Rhodomonas_salina.9
MRCPGLMPVWPWNRQRRSSGRRCEQCRARHSVYPLLYTSATAALYVFLARDLYMSRNAEAFGGRNYETLTSSFPKSCVRFQIRVLGSDVPIYTDPGKLCYLWRFPCYLMLGSDIPVGVTRPSVFVGDRWGPHSTILRQLRYVPTRALCDVQY